MFKNEKAFTLIEMLIVLMIISVLIILIVPNLAEKGKEVNEKGCDALVSVVQAQVEAYYIEEKIWPISLDDLQDSGYITTEQTTCPNGKTLSYTIVPDVDTGSKIGKVSGPNVDGTE